MKFTILASTLVLLTLTTSPSMSGSCDGTNHVHPTKEAALLYFEQMDVNKDNLVDKFEFTKSKISNIVSSFEELQPDVSGVLRKDAFIEYFVKVHADFKPNS